MINNTLEYMKKQGVPLTRENYLDYAYLGNPPQELGPEEEAQIPEGLESEDGEPVKESEETEEDEPKNWVEEFEKGIQNS
jgi:hypothetical protein